MKEKVARVFQNSWVPRILILLVIMVVMAIFQPRFFLGSNMRSILLSISIYGVMCSGMIFVIIIGGIDFCVGSTAAMAACVLVCTLEKCGNTTSGFLLGAAYAMGLCVLLGLLHGVLMSYMGLQPFVVTLATQYTIYGAMLMYTGGNYIYPENRGIFYAISNTSIFGIPTPIIWFVLFAIASAVILGRTSFGRKLYFVGGNRDAAKLVGISTNRITIAAYVVSSVTAGVAGIILGSLNMQVYATTASGYEGKVLTAMVVGGINLMGGEGGLPGVIFGALFVGVLNNVLVLLNVATEYQTLIQGVIIIVAIALNVYAQNKGLEGSAPKKASVKAGK